MKKALTFVFLALLGSNIFSQQLDIKAIKIQNSQFKSLEQYFTDYELYKIDAPKILNQLVNSATSSSFNIEFEGSFKVSYLEFTAFILKRYWYSPGWIICEGVCGSPF